MIKIGRAQRTYLALALTEIPSRVLPGYATPQPGCHIGVIDNSYNS